MDLLERAGLAPSDLAPDPLHPFKVSAASPRVRAKLLHVGWADLDDARRAPLLRRLLAAMTAAAWDAFLDATYAAAVAAEPDGGRRWTTAPWALWRTVLDDEAESRARPAVAIDADKRASQRERLLAILRARGPKGALNGELNEAVGFRYSARVAELRSDGYVIRTDQLAAQSFRFVLVCEPGMQQQTLEVA